MVAQVQNVNTDSGTLVKVDDAGKNSNSSSFTNEQYQQLMSLLNKANNNSLVDTPQSGCIYALCSSIATVCLTSCHKTSDWILDLGATDHITCQYHLLHDIIPCHIKISLPNGQISTEHHKGKLN